MRTHLGSLFTNFLVLGRVVICSASEVVSGRSLFHILSQVDDGGALLVVLFVIRWVVNVVDEGVGVEHGVLVLPVETVLLE